MVQGIYPNKPISKAQMNPISEHVLYDIEMAEHSILMLQKTTDFVLRNILHVACTNYVYNLLVFAGTDIYAFRDRAESQVRTLTSKRNIIQSEKLDESDYRIALDHVINLMLEQGIVRKNT